MYQLSVIGEGQRRVNPALAACFVATVLFFFELLAVTHPPKAVEVIHLTPRLAIGVADIDFQVRLQPDAGDRKEWAILCLAGEPCGLTFGDHERLEERDIEGEAAPKLWHPRAFQRVGPGVYSVIGAVGTLTGIRASDAQRVEIVAPE